jgi:HSP20 family molecular chaperone IbpA
MAYRDFDWLFEGKGKGTWDRDARVLRLEVPGTKPEDLVVSEQDSVLLVENRSTGRKQRYCVPPDTDVESVSASYEYGALSIGLPALKPSPQVRNIEVRSSQRG